MGSAIVGINLFGAVALLLFGLNQVRDGMERAFGARLKAGLAGGTCDGLRSFCTGLVATVALQSSTATALIAASFVGRDLILPRMAQVVLLGANVGTAVTAWIVALGLGWLSPLLLLSGVVIGRGSSNARKGAGAALVGVGLMLLSLHLIGAATAPLRASAAFRGRGSGWRSRCSPVLRFQAVPQEPTAAPERASAPRAIRPHALSRGADRARRERILGGQR